ncbi:RNA polymerase sigma factor [Parapedobacter deserti]|uniref:RNA polymerase sigma factor n=1 Tax=Parapedobacter deserti TaxID=1912957 RepID=A0ABV7JLX9_9SPHI
MLRIHGNNRKEWLAALKLGDHQAFESLYLQYKRQIYHNLYRLMHHHEVAEELTHDTFLKVWQLRETLDSDRSISAFLQKIAGNLAMDYYRRAARDKRMQEELIRTAALHDPAPGEQLERAESQALVRAVLERLPPKRRAVFALCRLEGKSYAEAAEILGIGVGTVNDHIVKATRFLRAELAKHPDLHILVVFQTAFYF